MDNQQARQLEKSIALMIAFALGGVLAVLGGVIGAFLGSWGAGAALGFVVGISIIPVLRVMRALSARFRS